MKRFLTFVAAATLLFLSSFPLPAAASNSLISLDVRAADIIDVLRLLASESNMSMVADDSLKHEKISLQLHDVTFSQAIRVLSRAYNLRIRRENNIIIVRPGTPSSVAIRLRYIRSCDALKYLKGALPDRAYSSDEKSNSILITGNEEFLATAHGLISSIDIPTPQVMFEVRVADIIRNNDSSNVGFLFGGLQTSSSVSNGLSNSSATQTPQQFNYQFTPFIGKTIGLFTQLNALVSHGSAKILATPRIATLNNQEAAILIGTQYPVVTTTATNGGSNVNVTYIDIGVKLRVTPTIGSDGSIIADLHPEVSTIDTIVQAAGSSAPQISDRRVDTTLRVQKDETIVLGGLLRDIDSTTISKLPFLGDIPVFGELFKNRQNTRFKDDVVFLITPHII